MATFRTGRLVCNIDDAALLLIGTDEDGRICVASPCGKRPPNKQALEALAEKMLQQDGLSSAAIIRAEYIFSKRPLDGSGDDEVAHASGPTDDRPVIFFDLDLHELWVQGTLVKRLDRRATNQIRILTALQEENWPPRVDDPLRPTGGDEKARFRSAIHCLNAHQKPFLIRFFADGTGHGVRWELVLY